MPTLKLSKANHDYRYQPMVALFRDCYEAECAAMIQLKMQMGFIKSQNGNGSNGKSV